MTFQNIPVTPLPGIGYGVYAPCVPSIGRNVKGVRVSLGLTQEQVAERCGVAQNQLSKWESGKQEPTVESLLKLAAGLQQPLEIFVSGVNRAFDLTRHGGDPQSDLSPKEGAQANVPAAARVELEHLRELVANYEKEAREMRTATDAIVKVALALETLRKTGRTKSDSRGRDRKVG